MLFGITKDIASVDEEPLELLLSDVVDVDCPGAVSGGHSVVQIKQLNGRVFGQGPTPTSYNFAEDCFKHKILREGPTLKS